ncbi:hypothetical protein L227DRAFT_289420 [Lentinus tigrinus ALCF2SS1-6]|uniref:Uncharacterized protein n=1 Tax=Lentinus tigrinus ALCF2SS1-6 TaxID=1328759 RepID=A0A5C2RY92_9APHY|nr:hypothetical protein L227DRAFT_289420 [Lentinus tigrinus ALCF2SS1-6]
MKSWMQKDGKRGMYICTVIVSWSCFYMLWGLSASPPQACPVLHLCSVKYN